MVYSLGAFYPTPQGCAAVDRIGAGPLAGVPDAAGNQFEMLLAAGAALAYAIDETSCAGGRGY